MNRSPVLLARIFAIIGALSLLGFAYATVSEILFLRHAVATEGRVVGLPDRATDQPTYLYEFPIGTVRRGRSMGGSISDQYLNGDRIPLYVDARNPDSAQIRRFDHQWLFPICLGVFGSAFAGVGFGILGYRRARRELERRIRDRGVRIRAEVIGVHCFSNIMINGVSPWRIHAQAMIDGKVRLFSSGHLWYDPSPYLDRKQVDVQYLAENPGKHWMDVSFLPELAE
jgi:hypothetical protein